MAELNADCPAGVPTITPTNLTGLVCVSNINSSWVNLGLCCETDPQIVNDGCTQYCLAPGDANEFGQCFQDLANGTYVPHFCQNATEGIWTSSVADGDSSGNGSESGDGSGESSGSSGEANTAGGDDVSAASGQSNVAARYEVTRVDIVFRNQSVRQGFNRCLCCSSDGCGACCVVGTS